MVGIAPLFKKEYNAPGLSYFRIGRIPESSQEFEAKFVG